MKRFAYNIANTSTPNVENNNENGENLNRVRSYRIVEAFLKRFDLFVIDVIRKRAYILVSAKRTRRVAAYIYPRSMMA